MVFLASEEKGYSGDQRRHQGLDGIGSIGNSKSSQNSKSSKRAFSTDNGAPRTDDSTGRISENHEVDVDRFHEWSLLTGLAGLLYSVIGSEKKEKKKDAKRSLSI